MDQTSHICVIGIGLIGQEIVRQLTNRGYQNVISCAHAELELTDQHAVEYYFMSHCPEYVFFCAVKPIADFDHADSCDADAAYANIMMQCNVIQAAHKSGVKKLIMLGSAMLYPWNLPASYDRLEERYLEEFNLPGYRASMESAVLSKLVGLKLCQYFRRQYGRDFYYCLPTHIYGGFQGRKTVYFLERLVIDICNAALTGESCLQLDVFGRGLAQKQFLHVKDCAEAIIRVMEAYEGPETAINICGDEVTCWSDIVSEICLRSGYHGEIHFNTERKENMANRICSAQKLKDLGWNPQISITDGIDMLCREYMDHKESHGNGKA